MVIEGLRKAGLVFAYQPAWSRAIGGLMLVTVTEPGQREARRLRNEGRGVAGSAGGRWAP